ncbi:39S ribosomal protein L53, mitochondrial isoform X1 [Osmia bicornis bicornis]|uniref:39S ribosomal protein L53, mitochondrial isoform X1 n=1 Tax=Osmia bicornis bicornis TaxID=1437191 RepID=UPI001EAE9A00|nr:39S ribosomal protein L53, mitochondrial isoform X1 [Osmia bicornis bicornis]
MSIPFNGTRTRSAGLISAIIKQLKSVNLKPVKSINIQFDPFHKKASEVSVIFSHCKSTEKKIIATNPRCVVKPQIVSDLSEPIIKFKLLSGDNVVFKTTNLTSLNILQLYNKHITPLAPVESETESSKSLEEAKKRKKKYPFKIKAGNRRRGLML